MTSEPAPPPSSSSSSSSVATTIGAAVIGLLILRFVAPRAGRSDSRDPGPPEGNAGLSDKDHAHPEDAAREQGVGRRARSPQEIPPKGWKDVLWRTYEEIGKDRILAVAAGVTYYALLAIFPAIGALVSMYGLFADPATIQEHLNALSGVLPSGAIEIVGDQVKRIASQGGTTLGVSFALGLLIAIWSANAGMKAIFDALNIVYDEEEKRGFVKLNLISLAFTAGALTFVLVALAAIVVLPILLEYIGLKSSTEWLVRLGRWPVLLLCVVAGLAVLYRYGPSRDLAKWKWVTPGGIVAALLWGVVSVLFSWYVANFGNYNETYGSLGAVIGFMTWIWVSAIVVLLGAEVNAEAEHQTIQDSTEGPHNRMGARGATVADTVGASKAAPAS